MGILQLSMLILAASIANAQNYCGICSDHTMCLYSGIGSKCLQPYTRGVDSTQQGIILKAHNDLRNRVKSGQETRGSPGPQPSASNMPQLGWDAELASIAQRWADQCDYSHDKCRNTGTYGWVGQNIALSSYWPCDSPSNAPDWSGIVNSWYNEVKDFDRSIVTKYRSTSAKTGHYTQVVWGATTKVGCGYTTWKDGTKCQQYYVCNYGPGGNVIGQRVYQ